MFEQDYIMRLIMDFVAGIRRSLEHGEIDKHPSEAAHALDLAVGNAVDLDPDMLLKLSPESAAGILQVSGTDPHVIEYAARSLLLAAHYYADAGQDELSDLRAAQAAAIADAYGCDLPDGDMSAESMEAFLDEKESENFDLCDTED